MIKFKIKCINTTVSYMYVITIISSCLAWIIYFYFRWLEIITACQKSLGISLVVTVARWRSIDVTKIRVWACWSVSVVFDVNIMSSSKGRSIAIVCVYSVTIVSIHGSFKRFEVVLILQGKNKRVWTVNITRWSWKKNIVTIIKKIKNN